MTTEGDIRFGHGHAVDTCGGHFDYISLVYLFLFTHYEISNAKALTKFNS